MFKRCDICDYNLCTECGRKEKGIKKMDKFSFDSLLLPSKKDESKVENVPPKKKEKYAEAAEDEKEYATENAIWKSDGTRKTLKEIYKDNIRNVRENVKELR